MKVSKYINRLSIINIKKKKQRTILSVISVGLSVAIIFTSLILFSNIYSLSKNTTYEDIGNFHYAINSATMKEANQRYNVSYDYDSGEFATLNNQYINIREIEFSSTNTMNPSAFIIVEGEYPKSKTEILIAKELGYKVGDTITLHAGLNEAIPDTHNLYSFPKEIHISDTKEKTYTVVGMYNSYSLMDTYTRDISLAYTLIDTKDSFVMYVSDSLIQLSNQYQSVLDYFSITENQAYYNNDVISLDIVHNYLQDTTTLLLMFIIIIVIALLISLITIQNIILMSDTERKRELGLLKSIGATTLEVKKLLRNELFILGGIGSAVGLVLGLIISYIVLNMFISNLHVTFHISMILQPILMVVAGATGIILMVVSGYKMYKKYITSYPIADLKETAYQYEIPKKPNKTTKRRSFAYRMFIIYNGRMKAQTKNIFYSFSLFIFTMILFLAVFISNSIYKNSYKSADYDVEVSNFSMETTSYEMPNLDLDQEIYRYVEDKTINAEQIYNARTIQNMTLYSSEKSLDETKLKEYKRNSKSEIIEKKVEGSTYINIKAFMAILDDYQLGALKNLDYEGSFDNLGSKDVICILYSDENNDLYSNLNIGDTVYLEDTKLTVKAIVRINADDMKENLYMNYRAYSKVFAVSSNYLEDYVALSNGIIQDRIQINLANKASISMVVDLISDTISTKGLTNKYVYTSELLVMESNRFTTFILESLLYPLFFLLMIISVININNVLISNVHIKRSDINIMKSVGMSNFQLELLFIFEYVEGYLNAAMLAIGIFIPICILESVFKIASAFKLSDNIFATIVITLFTVGVFVLVPLVMFSLKKITSISPIENMKDMP